MSTNYTINNEGITLIKSYESLRLHAYLCPANVLTVGYGHTGKDVSEGMVITHTRANELLQKDLKRFERGVAKLTAGVELNENQFSALVSFAFNVGLKALRTSTLLKRVNANPDDKDIANQFARWNRGGGVVLKGLVRRRAAECDLYFKP